MGTTRTMQRLGLALFLAIAVLGTAACATASRIAGEVKPSTNAVAPAPPMDSLSKGEASSQSSAGSAAGYDGGSTTTLPSQDATRLMIRTGSMDLVVRSVQDAVQSARDATSALGGFVSDSSLSGSGDQQTAQMTLRVPSNKLDDAIARLKGLAVEVRTASTSSRDVTEEVIDIEASLRNLRSVEAQYTQLLGRATNVIEVLLQVQQHLDQTRLQIDRTEARRKVLASQAELSTLSVSMRSSAVAGTGRLAVIEQAWAASLHTLDRIITGTVVTVVFFWWLIPLALIGLWIGLRDARRRRAARSTPTG